MVSNKVKPLQIRGRSLTAMSLHLSGLADDAFLAALDARLEQTPNFFNHAPLVIDLSAAEGLVSIEAMSNLARALQNRKLTLLGVQNATPEQVHAAHGAGLIAVPPAGSEFSLERLAAAKNTPETVDIAPQPDPPSHPTKVVIQPVRSGQTVFAEHGDLIVIAPVSAGAEVMALGNVHIYGPLRGRAMAGVGGDEAARIFCQRLEAEIVSVAGIYRTSESFGADVPRDMVQIYQEDGNILISALR